MPGLSITLVALAAALMLSALPQLLPLSVSRTTTKPDSLSLLSSHWTRACERLPRSVAVTLLGEAGLRRLAAVNHANACDLADRLADLDEVDVLNKSFFNEFAIRVPGNAAKVIEKMAKKGVLAGVPASRLWPKDKALADVILVANTEVNTDDDRAAFVAALGASL